ncbi:SDR family NAD(P)-dependent oxidoreductase, partial [Chloroflexota bacterium]
PFSRLDRGNYERSFGYHSKRVVITGASSGMGQAMTKLLGKLRAEIYEVGRNRVTILVKRHIMTDLRNKDSIDAAVELIPGNFSALFNCAGVRPSDFSKLNVVLTNFVG